MSTYTEEEAKTKWCPFVRVSNGPDGSWNRFDAGHVSDRECYACIGSRCMAWRARPQWRARSDYPWEDGKPHLTGQNVETRTVGHCGLAGAPQ